MSDDKASDDPIDVQLGRVIDGRYRLLGPLGEGGMGAVYLAEHLGLMKEVALKMVRPEHAGNAGLAARFAREAMVTSKVEHPNVISALDFGTLEDGTAYLVTQLVRGESLSQLIEADGPMHWARAADIAAQIADALCAAKAKEIVHRDLKPENVLVERSDDGIETVKVLDFGIAKYTRDSLAPPSIARAQRVTQSGMVIGTPGYMAPEQAVGQPADNRSDLYALGVLAWECVVGRRLWTGEDPRAIISNQLKSTAQKLRAAAGDATIPLDFEDLVAALLSNAPSGRPSDPSIVRDLLREIAATGRMAPMPQRGAPRRTQATPKDVHATRPMRALPSPTPSRNTTPFSSDLPPQRQPRRYFLMSLLASAFLVAIYAAWASGFVQRSSAEGGLVIAPMKELAPRVVDLWKHGRKSGRAAASPQAKDGQASPSQASQALGTGLPAELEPQLMLLVQAESGEQRRSAARALLGHIPVEETPAYVRALARFQLAESCPDKREPLALLDALKDRRALPALMLASDRAKNGCRRKDCLACVRGEVERVIGKLESSGGDKPGE
ncbi:MAG TPA: serine/threonine-protein kinase [Polyangiales bacterium]|nr:serine/threonine-protein kinase [Polyangiales bacterium]